MSKKTKKPTAVKEKDELVVVNICRGEQESMLLAITRVLENSWRNNTNVKGLLLNKNEFKLFLDETQTVEEDKINESICLKLYAGTMRQIFAMQMEQHPDDDFVSIAILGDRPDFDYDNFIKEANK